MGAGVSRHDLGGRQNHQGSQKDAGEGPRAAPTTGMRGGLGRTLLTAFLILTIVPLSVIGVYAVRQSRENVEREVGAKLLAIATLKAENLADWLQQLRRVEVLQPLTLDTAETQPSSQVVVSGTHRVNGSDPQAWWDALERQAPGLAGAAVLSVDDGVVWSVAECDQMATRALAGQSVAASTEGSQSVMILERSGAEPAGLVVIRLFDANQDLALCLETGAVTGLLQAGVELGETGRVSLVHSVTQDRRTRYWPSGQIATLPPGGSTAGDALTTSSHRAGYDLYQNEQGESVIGAFYPLPDLGAGVLVEQSQDEVLASTERIVATLIALILTVALVTTAAAAVVIRQITRPVIDLTESAVSMAEGNLDQHLAVRSRDEIGILTFVFNEMAAELKSLYSDLEAKVIERTKRLQQANYQIQRRALHLQASQEVSQAITSIRDPDLLLTRVTDLIRSHFIYASVAVYIVAPGGGEARLQASSPIAQADVPGGAPSTVGSAAAVDGDGADGMGGDVDEAVPEASTTGADDRTGGGSTWPARCWPGDGSVVGRAVRKGETQVHNEPTAAEHGWYSRYQSRVAIPLKMADRGSKHHFTVGAIAVSTTAHEGIQHDELEVLEGLANQVTIALENARAYERERLAMEQMEAAEAFKARFLGNMSRELREPLNTVIGFSRLLIKGIDGPLNARQIEDLEQIHNDSQHLLFLINDILSISQIQAGLMALRLQPVDLRELLLGVMPTASALVRGRDIGLRQELPLDLPHLYADPTRLRQVLVHLLNNAAKFTEAGEIVIRAWSNEDEVYVSVSDTGIGIPVDDRERIFAHFEKGRRHEQRAHDGIGLGLALCREYVELHGGRIWVDSDVGVGSTFTFSVPVYEEEMAEAVSGNQDA